MIHRTAPVVAASTALAGIFLQFDTGGPLRALLMVWFFLAVPGLSLVGFFEPLRPEARVSLVIGISIVTTVAVSQVLLYADEWTVELGFAAVAMVSLVGMLTQVLRSLGQRVAVAQQDQRSYDFLPVHHRPENLQLDDGVAVGDDEPDRGHSAS